MAFFFSVANLSPMLPSVPKSLGRLSEAYLSAFLALSGATNPLMLPGKKSYLMILVDGLGVSNIQAAGAHASFLQSKLKTSRSLFAGFPTTTASSLTSLATGKPNGEHAFLGYRVYDRKKKVAINLLNDLGDKLNPRDYQDLETISEKALAAGLTPVSIGTAEYADSGFTAATMSASIYIAAKSLEDRFRVALEQLRKPGTLVSLYIPELDQLAHRFGASSNNWLAFIEELNSELVKFSSKIPKDAGAFLTADHGILDVAKSEHIYLEGIESLQDLVMIGGDPRALFLYFPHDMNLERKKFEIEAESEAQFDIATIAELVEAGWLAPLSETAQRVAPDFVLLPRGERVAYHRNFSKAASIEMVGQHGGMTKKEWEVPLIVF
jgi:predicted AlkP superfamily pyrophosphatase or phosphodiesterase